MQPDRHALVDVRYASVRLIAPREEQADPDEDEREARRRDVEHRQEDAEVEEARAEVVRRDEHEHAGAPDHEQRPNVLQPRLCERLPLLAQVRGEEDDQEDLRELAGLKPERAEVHPQAGAVHGRPDAGYPRQEEEHDRSDPEQVLVLLEHAEVASQADEGKGEQPDADHDPEALLEGVVRAEAVDLGHADRGEQAGHRQEIRVGVRDGRARDEMRSEVEAEEEEGVAQRAPADERLARDVHRREADAGQDADDA